MKEANVSNVVASVAQVLGLGAIVAACFLVSLVLGLAAAGLALLLVGFALDAGNR